MARLVAWNYHQEDWGGKGSGQLAWMRFYDASNNQVLDTGWRDINGRHSYANGTIGGNFNCIKRLAMRWVRDTDSGGGGYWRVWVTDDMGQKYLVAISKHCRTGNGYVENHIDLGGGWDSGWAGYNGSWRLRRVQIYNTNGCVSVCNCREGNCSCRGNYPCECQSGRCGAYGCSCNNRCSNNCPFNKGYGCICNSQKTAVMCSADCASHTCNCNANVRFRNEGMIYSSDIVRLYDEIRASGSYVGVNVSQPTMAEGLIETGHVQNMTSAIKSVYDKVKQLNPKFNYDFTDIENTLPTDNNKTILLSTYKKISDLALQVQTLCKSHNSCPNNCPSYNSCQYNCTCNYNNPGQWVTEGWVCPCNSQCSCNGNCVGVCSNCACNAQDITGGCYIV